MSGMSLVVVALVVLLVVLMIVVNLVQQQKEKKETEKRQESVRQKAIIDETEEVMLLSSKIPMSSNVVSMLLNRIGNALQSWNRVAPTNDLKQRLKDIKKQQANIKTGYREIAEATFTIPDNEKHAVQMLQGIKKLRLLLRAEHNKGTVPPAIFVEEEKRIDRLMIRINLDNLVSRATSSLLTQQIGSCRQMLDKAEAIVASVAVPDDYVKSKIASINDMRAQIQEITQKAEAENMAKVQTPAEDEQFTQKKW
ncbi:hypothetical protein [Echinimonas agarilytica]|uniref:DNA repair protein n=1 Tax=Echinimonas agarilytica TaxID=1215918 RepID=A0AA41W7H5_9GAMM|nr:hypothetical protein [Echinimonas agarilytica]MCM2679773.1 hypothetical protein [Echinimonas agarilytica]